MKKLLLATAVVAAAGAAGYLYQNNLPQSGSSSLLAQIPADSLVVTFQTEPFKHYEYVNAFGSANQMTMSDMFVGEQLSPKEQFAIDLFDGYLKSAASPETLKAYLGTGDEINQCFTRSVWCQFTNCQSRIQRRFGKRWITKSK